MSFIPTNKQNKNKNDTISTVAPWRVVNIGNQNHKTFDFIRILEKCLKKAIYNFLSVQPGEVLNTFQIVIYFVN